LADDVEYLLCQHANSNETFKIEVEPNFGFNIKLHLQEKCFVHHWQTQSTPNSCSHDLHSISSVGQSCFNRGMA
jgi:hypothetical protein